MLRYPILLFLLFSYYLHADRIGAHWDIAPYLRGFFSVSLLWAHILAYGIGLYANYKLPACSALRKMVWIALLLACLILAFATQLWLFILSVMLLSISIALLPVQKLSLINILALSVLALLSAWSLYEGADWRSVFIIIALLAIISKVLEKPSFLHTEYKNSPFLSYMFMIYALLIPLFYFVHWANATLFISAGAIAYFAIQTYYGATIVGKHSKLWTGIGILHILCWGLSWILHKT